MFDYSSVNTLLLPVDADASVMHVSLKLIRLIIGAEDTFAGSRPSRVEEERINRAHLKLHNALLIA